MVDKYEDNENAFLYLDPHYVDIFTVGYNTCSGKSQQET